MRCKDGIIGVFSAIFCKAPIHFLLARCRYKLSLSYHCLVNQCLRIEDGVFLKPKRSTGETFRRHLRKKDVFNEYNDWATVKKETLWDDNLIRRLKKGMGVMDENLVKRLKKQRAWDRMLVRMI